MTATFVGDAADGQQRASVAGVVRDSTTGRPLPDAEVSVPALRLSVRTDTAGHYRLAGLPAGRHQIMVRRIGFDSTSVSVTLTETQALVQDFALTARPQALSEIEVAGARRPDALSRHLADFERRRQRGIGRFLTEEQVATTRGRPTGDIVSMIPGTLVLRSRNSLSACVALRRGTQSFQSSTAPCGDTEFNVECAVAVLVDGVKMYSGAQGEPLFDVNVIPSREIAGIELYAGAASIPTEFATVGRTCGALLIWTKRVR